MEEKEKCLTTLPSGQSAQRLIDGDWSAIPMVVLHTALRGLLASGGIYLLGDRKHAIRNGFAAAVGIEIYILTWASLKKVGGV